MWEKWLVKKEAVMPNFKAKKAFAQDRIDDSLFRWWVGLLLYVYIYILMQPVLLGAYGLELIYFYYVHMCRPVGKRVF